MIRKVLINPLHISYLPCHNRKGAGRRSQTTGRLKYYRGLYCARERTPNAIARISWQLDEKNKRLRSFAQHQAGR